MITTPRAAVFWGGLSDVCEEQIQIAVLAKGGGEGAAQSSYNQTQN